MICVETFLLRYFVLFARMLYYSNYFQENCCFRFISLAFCSQLSSHRDNTRIFDSSELITFLFWHLYVKNEYKILHCRLIVKYFMAIIEKKNKICYEYSNHIIKAIKSYHRKKEKLYQIHFPYFLCLHWMRHRFCMYVSKI